MAIYRMGLIACLLLGSVWLRGGPAVGQISAPIRIMAPIATE